jgi:hypothetical protein
MTARGNRAELDNEERFAVFGTVVLETNERPGASFYV